jgi:inosine-uridine nucleoside N-ribohydrolase
VDVMIEELMNGPGQVVPVTIGAMTNLAMARTKEPRLVGRISQVVAMAGEFDRPKAEWNIRCDPEAAHLIFTSGVRVTVVPFSLGRAARFHGEEVQQLRQSDRPLARHLAETIAAWRGAWRQPTGQPSLYDPAAVAALLRPELFVWQTGRVQVELRGEQTYGYTTFTPGEGPHRVARELKTEEFVKWLMARLVGEG